MPRQGQADKTKHVEVLVPKNTVWRMGDTGNSAAIARVRKRIEAKEMKNKFKDDFRHRKIRQ